MLGFIALNKPAGLTSHDCVAKVRRLLKLKKVGHGGTLDPLATGVLPIAVGKATRLLTFLPENKVYQARIRLGVQTTTDDLEGEAIAQKPTPTLSLEDVNPLLEKFMGTVEQIPPAYSAIQRGGKRLYELARKGEQVEVPRRTVTIQKIAVLGWYPGDFPELAVEIHCGPGTYIRAIARDLGTHLGVGGTLAQLKRTESCGMKLSDTLTPEELSTQIEQDRFSLLKPDPVLQDLPKVDLSLEEGKRWCQGQKILTQGLSLSQNASLNPVRVYDETGEFLGMGLIQADNDHPLLIPKVVIH